MGYMSRSGWNDENELRCLLVFKKLERDGFPRGDLIKYSRELALLSNLKANSISAKVCNYKSVAGIIANNNSSSNTERIYKGFKDFSVEGIEKILCFGLAPDVEIEE